MQTKLAAIKANADKINSQSLTEKQRQDYEAAQRLKQENSLKAEQIAREAREKQESE